MGRLGVMYCYAQAKGNCEGLSDGAGAWRNAATEMAVVKPTSLSVRLL